MMSQDYDGFFAYTNYNLSALYNNIRLQNLEYNKNTISTKIALKKKI